MFAPENELLRMRLGVEETQESDNESSSLCHKILILPPPVSPSELANFIETLFRK